MVRKRGSKDYPLKTKLTTLRFRFVEGAAKKPCQRGCFLPTALELGTLGSLIA
jgi:hypothetical protein